MIELIKSYILVRMNNDKEINERTWGWYPYDPEEDTPSQLLCDWLEENTNGMDNWPEVEHGGNLEDVDLENVEFIRLTDDLIEFDAGGDWQDPTRIIIELVDGKLTCTSAIPCEDFGDGELSQEQIEEILKIEE